MARRRGRAGLDSILNLDSLVDVVTNTNGMLILLAVFTTLLAIGKAYTLSFPMARASSGEQVFFECRDHRVVALSFDEHRNEAYRVIPMAFGILLEPRKGDHGDPAVELRSHDSAFRQRVEATDPATQYAVFLVRSDSFEVFLAAREALAELRPGLGVGWEPIAGDGPLAFSTFFGSAVPVQ